MTLSKVVTILSVFMMPVLREGMKGSAELAEVPFQSFLTLPTPPYGGGGQGEGGLEMF